MSEAWGILVLVLLGYAVYRLWQIENQLWRIVSQLRRIEEYVRVIAVRPKPPEDDESPDLLEPPPKDDEDVIKARGL